MRRSPSVLVACAVLASPLGAQTGLGSHETDRWANATWVDDLNFLGANVLIGALTAGVSHKLRGGSFSEAFARGALGGGIGYAGKRLTAARFDGAGLLGRELSAVGWSIVRNAGQGVPVLDTLVLPLGPVRAFVPTGAPFRTRVRVDATDVAWLASAVANQRLRFDWGSSLSAGAPVFLADGWLRSGDDTVNGMHAGGLVVATDLGAPGLDRVLAHERVHVTQIDFVETAIAYPLEDLLGRRLGAHRSRVGRALLPGLAYVAVLYPMTAWLDREGRPIEVEADFLESR